MRGDCLHRGLGVGALGIAILAAFLWAFPAPGYAVSFVQHSLPPTAAEVQELYVEPAGLVLAAGASPGHEGAMYDLVSVTPTFALRPGPPGQPAGLLWTGPEGAFWYEGLELQRYEGALEGFTTFVNSASGALAFRDPAPERHTGRRMAATVSDGVTYFANTDGTIERYVYGQITQQATSFPLFGPVSIVTTASGAVWFTDVQRGDLGEITPAGETIERPISDGDSFGGFGFTEPYGLTVGPDGALWFTEQTTGRIGRMTETGELQEFPIPDPSGAVAGAWGAPAPRNITVGPDGAMWFTDPGDHSIGRITTSGQVTEYPITTTPSGTPDEIVSYGGELWFSEQGVPALASLNPTGTATAPPPSTGSKPPAAAAALMRTAQAQFRRIDRRTLLRRLLRNGTSNIRFRPPSAGTVTVECQLRGPLATRDRRQVVAAGQLTFRVARAGTVKITLTAHGRHLIARARTSGLVIVGQFLPGRAASASSPAPLGKG